ncbi:MAG: FtsH protease activity modulator HflK [Gemmatimonas sp.]
MPWTNQGGGGGGPWGGGSRGPGGQGPWNRGPQPPDLEDLLRRSQDRFRKVFPGGAGGSRGLVLIILAAIAVWLASGFYRVQPDEQGVVMRFGQWLPDRTTLPGFHYHLPFPIETVLTPKVTTVNRVDVGFRSTSAGTGARTVAEEALMLTGDENIVDINFTVFWVIKDAGQFLFNVRDPEDTVKAMAESAMREVIGKTKIQAALAEARREIETSTRTLLQQILDHYGSGIEITQLQLQKVDPPAPVVDAFRDVQRARADAERARNEAESYANDILPRARGDAERIIQEAEAYKQEVVARAQGDAQRFLSVYEQYRQAKDVTTRRIYLETMEQILARANKMILDPKGGSGAVPYLPLPSLAPRPAAPAEPPSQSQPQSNPPAR